MSKRNGNRPEPRKCKAKTRAGGECQRPAGWGTDHPGYGTCKLHLGSTRNLVRAAEAERIREHVVALGLDAGLAKIDPREALELELWRTHVNVLMYEQLCRDLTLDGGDAVGAGIYGRLYHPGGQLTGEAKPHVLIVMRDAERDRLRKVAVECAAAGIEERRVELAEERAKLIADVFRVVLGSPELGLSAERRRIAMTLAARQLRQVAATSEAPA